MTHSKKVLLISVLFIIGILTLDITAQSANSKDWKKKAKSIIGEPESVTVKTNEGTYIFDKDEAQELVKYLKSEKRKFKYFTKHVDKENRVIFLGDDKLKHHLVEIDEDSDLEESNVFIVKKEFKDIDFERMEKGKCIEKTVEIREEDGIKIVEIVSEKDGEDIVIIYSGTDAEDYIKNHIDDKDQIKGTKKLITIDIDIDDEDFHTLWVTDSLEEEGVTNKEIEIKVKDGKKNVTITKTKDGKEFVEILEGEEAEEFIKKHGSHKISNHIIHKLNGKHKDVTVFKSKSNQVKMHADANWNMIEEVLDDNGKSVKKKFEVNIEDSKKKVTVTTTEDGKEKVEIFEGKEADEYLENNKSKKIFFISEDGNVSTLKHGDGTIIKIKEFKDCNEIEVEVEVDEDKQVEKKVKVKK